MKKYEVKDHSPSYLPDGDWKMVWADEFDGSTLDNSKWDTRLYMMGKRAEQWVDDAYELDGNSHLVLKLEKRNGIYCTTQLQTGYNFLDSPGEKFDASKTMAELEETNAENYFSWQIGEIKEPKFMHKYGFYECRCKLQQKEGWWSAFWLQSPIIGSTMNPEFSGIEVDIMEYSVKKDLKLRDTISHTNHWNGYGAQHESSGGYRFKLKETDDGFHTFGLDWTPEYYRYYVDGELTYELKAPYPISQAEQFILLSAEAIGYRKSDWNAWEALAEAEGDAFVVDYVRVFDRI